MITDKGKAFIARNFGVSNCYALDDVVSCTVYSKGAPSERVLDTPTIVFLLVTDIADWVRTPTGRFTLDDLVAANEGNYISMTEALDIAAYCIPGAAPPTAPIAPAAPPGAVTPLTLPPGTSKDFEILNPSVNCDSMNCRANFNLKNNSSSSSAYIRLDIDGAPRYKRYAYVLRGGTKPQVLSTSIAGLSPGYHNLTIVVGLVTDTDMYTHRFLVGAVAGTAPPAAAKITKAEVITELGRRGAIETAALSTTTGKDKWYLVRGAWGGTWVSYVTTNFTKSISLDIDVRNPPTRTSDISFKVNNRVVNELDRDWVLARLGELYAAAPPAAAAPDTMSVTADSAIPLWIWDEDGEERLPCTRYNAMAGGTAFGITVCKGGYDKIATLIIPHTHIVPPFTMPFDITLSDIKTPVHLHGRYTGTVFIDGGKGKVHVKITSYPTPPAAPAAALPAPTNIRVTHLTSDYAYVEWDGVLECCSDPNAQREYCACEFGITLNGVSKSKVFSDPYPGTDCEELTPGTRYTMEIQTRSPPNIYTYRKPSEKVSFTFTTPAALITPPATPPVTPAAKITKAGIITELTGRGAIDISRVSTVPAANKWYMYYKKANYHSANFEKVIEISNLQTRNPATQVSDIALSENRTPVSEIDRDWVMSILAGLPFTAPPTAASLSAPEFIAEIRRIGTLDLARISMIPGDNKWFMFAGQLVYRVTGGKSGIVITSPGKSNMYAAFSKNEAMVARVERNWAMARIGELPFTGAPAAPPATAAEPPEPIKNWIAVNYGDGTRVTADGWRKLNTAKMANALAALPAGYSKGDITEGVVLWAKANPNWETRSICGWISSIRVTSLTEDHGLYIYNLAIGWTTLATNIYATLSPKPSKPSAAIVTEDNGLGVYDYAIGWKTLANTITGCNF